MVKRKCVIANCKTNLDILKYGSANTSSHKFPLKEEERLNQWLINIGRPSWLPSTYDKICSLHFEPKYLINRINKTTMLLENAVPTIFEPAIETVNLVDHDNHLSCFIMRTDYTGLKAMIDKFNVKHLQAVLKFANRKLSGNKKLVKYRLLNLIKDNPSIEISNKIKQIFREEIQQQQQQPSSDQLANNQRVASNTRMLPSTTGGVWQLGYNMRSRQGTAMTTRGQAAAASNATSPTELQPTPMQTTVPQQNTQNMQQLSPRATVYPLPNYTQQEIQNARHHMNPAVNINQTRQMSYNPMYTRYSAQPVPAFPVHPDVVFKRLPFFDHLGDLVKPSSLIPSNTPQRIQEQQFTFHLTPGQATEIATNRDVRPNAKLDFVYQVQLRFCLLETSCEQEDFFPPGVTVKVNNKICPLPNPIPTNKQGVEPKRPPKPVNITPLVKLSPTVMNHVQIGWAADYNKGYVIRISMVRKLTAAQLLTRLKSKGVKHADHTTGLIKEKLNEDADCEIATTSLRVSLLCPLGKFRMNVPCRATTCNHLQCFDASVYLEMNERRATWTCPVCDKPALYDNLVIDGYFQDVLNSPKLPHGECDIELHKDGSWQVHVAKKETPVNNTSASESVEILSDEIEVIPIASSTTSNVKSTTASSDTKEEPKKMPVVDLTLSDSDDEDDLPLKRKTPSGTTSANSQQRPDSTKRRMIENNGSVSSTSSTNSNNTRYTGTPGPSNVSSSGYQSPSVITLLDSPSPPPRD